MSMPVYVFNDVWFTEQFGMKQSHPVFVHYEKYVSMYFNSPFN